MLKLTVDAQRWHNYLTAFVDSCPGIVPVTKGNGYGFGHALTVQESQRLGVDVIAVGVAQEVASMVGTRTSSSATRGDPVTRWPLSC